ncbi:hypothetical protein X739_10315 [Mesorhizobium sp. LNHC220B00]|nr:hypothetical protein [Mesorhizobium sp. LNHC220B00]ESY87080.1 hypothetical protein X739_10315 [Mesorhizobium sp. LNHC220B00]
MSDDRHGKDDKDGRGENGLSSQRAKARSSCEPARAGSSSWQVGILTLAAVVRFAIG